MYIFKKILNLIITLFFVSLSSFFLFQLAPGDPANIILGSEAESKQVETFKKDFELEDNIFKNYLNWILKIINGDLGRSIRFNEDVRLIISKRIPITLFLTLLTLILIIIITSILGFVIIKYNNTFISKFISISSQIIFCIPNFLLAIIISLFFGINLNLFPIYGYSFEFKGKFTDIFILLWYLFLPAFSLAISNSSLIIRFLKNLLDEQLKMDYVQSAIIRGISKNKILFKHILKNCLVNIVTILGLIISDIIGGSIIIENIFSISGIGSLIVTSISTRDFVLLQGIILYITFFIIIINFIIDIIYTIIDPRVKIK